MRPFLPLLFVTLALADTPLSAQLPTPRLTQVFPPGGRLGSTVEVVLAGADFDGVNQLVFSAPSITATPKMGADNVAEVNRFVVNIPAEAPVGVIEARAVGRFGISNPRAFVIGDLNELIVPSTNLTAATAVELTLGATVNARVPASQASWYRFKAKQGQRVLARAESTEIDSRLQEVIVLYDEGGRELQINRRSGLLDFTASADGEYRLKLHDFTYRGGDEYFYRLTVSTGPWIDFVYPPAGLAGTTGKYLLLGRNLPGSSPAPGITRDGRSLEKLEVEIQMPGDAISQVAKDSSVIRPNEAALDALDYRLRVPQGVSNPVRVGFASAPVTVEPLDSDGSQPQKLNVPCEFVGRFRSRGQATTLLFDAKKGDVFWIECISQRLNQPVDPFAVIERVIRNDKGEESYAQIAEMADNDANLGGTDFNTTTRDPIHRFNAPEDATYRVRLRDLFNRNEGASRHLYRISLRREAPDFKLIALAEQPPKPNNDSRTVHTWTTNLRRQETQVLKVLAQRRDGFNGEIILQAEGLPAGISVGETRIEAGKNAAFIPFTAREDAPSGFAFARISGRADIGGKEVVRQAAGASVVWHVGDFNNEPVGSRLNRNVAVGVCGAEKAALSLVPVGTNIFQSAAGGKIQIPVQLNRQAEFGETLKFKVSGLSALGALGELEITTKTNMATLEIDLEKFKLPAGTHQFILQAQTKGKYRSYAAESQAADNEAARADEAASKAANDAKKAAEALAQALKAATEAEAQAKGASDKDRESLAAKANSAVEAKVAAEKISAEAAAKLAEAEKKKSDAQARKKDLNAKAAGKDATIMVYSEPITLKLNEPASK